MRVEAHRLQVDICHPQHRQAPHRSRHRGCGDQRRQAPDRCWLRRMVLSEGPRHLLDQACLRRGRHIFTQNGQLQLQWLVGLHPPAGRAQRPEHILRHPKHHVGVLIGLPQHYAPGEGCPDRGRNGRRTVSAHRHVHPDRPAVDEHPGERGVPATEEVLVLLAEAAETIDQNQYPRLGWAIRQAAVLAEGGRPSRREPRGSFFDHPGQVPQQPLDALIVLAGDDGPHIRQWRQKGQPATSEIKPIDVHRPAAWGDRRRNRQRTQCSRLPGPAGADVQDVAVVIGVEVLDLLGLMLRVVEHAQHDLGVAALPQLRQVVDGTQLVEPRPPWLGDPRVGSRPLHSLDDPVGVLRHVLPAQRPLGYRPALARSEVQLLHLDRRGLWFIGRARTRVGRLEGDHPPGPRFCRTTTRDRGREEGRHRRSEHIGRILLVGHPQGNAQVGVGSQVVLDDPGWALRRQDQMQAQ